MKNIYIQNVQNIFLSILCHNKHEAGYGRWLQTNLQDAVKLLCFHLKLSATALI